MKCKACDRKVEIDEVNYYQPTRHSDKTPTSYKWVAHCTSCGIRTTYQPDKESALAAFGKFQDAIIEHEKSIMKNFNKLTPAEVERLALLAEEMSEAIQVIGKILRHGFDSIHPNGGPNNRALLEKELGDVRHAMIKMCETGDINKDNIHLAAEIKRESVAKYLHHQ